MISIKKLRKNKDSFLEKLALKQDNTDLDLILSLDEKLRELKTSSSQMRAERNSASEAIGQAKKAGEDATEAINNMRVLGENLKKLENDLHDVSDQMNELLYKIPNPPHDSSPEGLDESDNIEIRSWGNKPEFDFIPKTHIEIGENLKLFDFNRGAKLSGSGFPLYIGQGAMLERALINSMLDHHQKEYDFKEIFPPVLMKKDSMVTTGQLPKFE